MEKLKRNERIGGIVKTLCDNPNEVITYNYFTDNLSAAKSTISEDIAIVKEMMSKLDLGLVETIPGASGGVKYIPKLSKGYINSFLEELCHSLNSSNRIIPGGFIYMTDVLFSPSISSTVGKIFSSKFVDKNIDAVITVETKGIPIALMTARALNVPLVIIRRNLKVTEGSSVNINYVTGSTKKIQTMSLSRRAIKEGSNVLIIDDFMKAGGTAKGMIDMMKEFNANVMGVGVMIKTKEPEDKLVKDYISLLTLDSIDENNEKINISPSI